MEEQLADKTIQINECGSVAEAALKISGIFEVAQKAADLYLENIKRAYSDGSEFTVMD